jgi:magnesium-transporting ATPase (P-type)
MAYLKSQGVRVVVISGDHPETVAAVARRAGVPDVGEGIDAAKLGDDVSVIEDHVLSHNVFGRVTPHQKREMVRALRRNGHVVAMTGDGVNDALALKEANVGLAMGSGTVATRAVAQLVLLDDKFSTFPTIVHEGRRVIANVERASTLFVTKSVYAFLLAVVVGVANVSFPFLPRHLTLVSSLTIGFPAFLLALGNQAPRLQPHYLRRLTRLTVPAGIATAAATSTTYLYARSIDDISRAEATTGATIALVSCGLWILSRVARPMSRARAGIFALAVGSVVGAMTIPAAKEFFELDYPPSDVWAVALLSVLAAGVVMEVSDRLIVRSRLQYESAITHKS